MSFITNRLNEVSKLATDFQNASPIVKIGAGVAAVVTTYGIGKGLITADQTALYGSMAAGILGTGMLGFLNQQDHNSRVSAPAYTRDGGPA